MPQVTQYATITVDEVVDIVREWVDMVARHWPGFAGAYMWGGITALPGDAPFALYRDVDVVVVTEEAEEDNLEIMYRGLMLEVIKQDIASHQDVEAVLSNPSLAPNMATTQILSDPTGILAPLQQAVGAQFSERRWIQARCEVEKSWAENALADMRMASTATEILDSLRPFLGALSGLLAVATLRRPTTRRTLTLLRDILEEQGRLDLHEDALALMGCAHMSRADVQLMLDQSMAAFDRAVQVYRTSTPYGFALKEHLRPYHAHGTQEMIDEGNHREAMYWVCCLDTAYIALQNDAPDKEKSGFDAQFRAMNDALGYTSAEVWAERVKSAERMAHEIFRLADDIVAAHPE